MHASHMRHVVTDVGGPAVVAGAGGPSVVTGIGGSAVAALDRSERRGRGSAPHVECATDTSVPDAIRSERLYGAPGLGEECVVDTGLVPGAETSTLADQTSVVGLVGSVGPEQAGKQLSGGVRRRDRYYYRSRRESGNAAEASGTSVGVPEATFSPTVLEGGLPGRQRQVMRLSGDDSNNELGSPSVNLEEGGSRTQAVEAGEGNVLGSIPELETLFHRCELCFRAFRKKVGLSLHMKAKHAVEYNATINTQRVKPRWEREESYLLAKAEVELGKVPNINLKLHERFPERSFDSIKSHRRQGFYRDMVAEIRAGRGSSFSVRPLEPDCTQEAGSCALSDTTDTSLVVDAPVPVRVHPPSPQRASPTSALAASSFLRRGSAGAQVTAGDQQEMDPGLLHQAGLGLLSESAGDTVGLHPVGDDAAAAGASAVSSTGVCQVPGHGSLQGLESTWASRLRRRRRPAVVTPSPPASPSSGDASSSESWSPDPSHGLAEESPGQAAASSLGGGWLGQGRPGGERASLHSRPRQSRALPEATGRGGSTAAGSQASSQGPQLQEGLGSHTTPSREALLRALRESVEEEPPEKFQGHRLWDVARVAISGADFLRPINDYIRDVFFLDQRRSSPRGSKRTPPREGRRRKRRREYARTQELFHKRPADCAREVLDGPAEAGVEDVRGFLSAWAGIMTGPLPPALLEPVARPDEEIDIFSPVTAKELREARLPLSSAPGPDGFTARLLRAVPSTILRVLLNLLMLLGRVPAALQAGRTVFIPKTSPATEAGHFRPITMAPVVQRLLHKVLARRLTAAVGLNFRQRAFQPVDGCAENVLLLATAIAEAKQRLRPLYMASIDLTKAFDRVSTEAIIRGAVRAGLADSFVAYVRDLYRTSQSILTYKGESLLVEPTTGVRQGDPLSPTMFNLVLDEYLSKTDPNVGFTSGEFRLDAMAFADDLLVFASTRRGLQERLDDLAGFLEPRGLRVNIAKSFTLVLQPSGREKKSKVETDSTYCIRNQPLPVATTATIWRYLGVQFSTKGRRRGGVDRDLRELLERVTRAPLKPQQRLFILRGFLLPRLHHRLVLGLWGIGTLSKLDRMTRAAIRKWLALPHDTPVGYFHAPVSEGGLGVTSLRTAIPGMTLARIQGLRFSDHPGCEAALRCRMLTDQVRRARQAANIDGVPLATKAGVHKYWADKLHGSYDGAALRETRHVPAAQSWVADGTRLLPGRHYVNVIKLRVNALPTLSRTKRGRPDDVSCRAGCRARESLGHVLQACHRGHRGRVKRHDNIARYIAMRLHQLEWNVLWEPHYTVQGKVMKPDLVATQGAQTIIIDVQVVGTGMELAVLHKQKATKYSVPDLLRQVQGQRREPPLVTTATMNLRGIWSRESARDLLSLGLTKSDLKLMTVRCLQGGLQCFWAHRRMTTVANNRG